MGNSLSSSNKTHTHRASRSPSYPPEGWQSSYAQKLSDQEIKDIHENISAFFSILEEWDHADHHPKDLVHPRTGDKEDRSRHSIPLEPDQEGNHPHESFPSQEHHDS